MRPAGCLFVAAGLLLAPLPAAAGGPGAQAVKLATKDGLTLEADWYAGEEGMPGIVGIPADAADRSSLRSLAAARPEGYHFLALDLRGQGGSRAQKDGDLGDRLKKRDPALLAALWQDAVAGTEYLRREAKCDPQRIGLLGAGLGASVAVDAAVHDRRVAGVLLLGPGAGEPGLPTMDHAKSWMRAPLLMIASEGDPEAAKRIAELLKSRPSVEVRLVPGGKDPQGTALLGKVAGLETRIAHWFEGVLGAEVPDGTIDACERSAPAADRGSLGTVEGGPPGSAQVRADALGLNVWFESGETDSLQTFYVTAEPDPPDEEFAESAVRLRGLATANGTLQSGAADTWSEKHWGQRPLAARPETAAVSGKVLELRVPWKLLSIRPGQKVRIGFRFVQGRMDWNLPPVKAPGTVVTVPE